MDKGLTLGSLFDGIGGFPYAASFFGIKALWASEIMPECISITKRHFPDMEHVGDITEIYGGDLKPVDIITFGSPCQDLSQAAGGRRQAAWACGGKKWSFPGGSKDYQGNERRNRWKISPVCGMGKCTRSFVIFRAA